jgi:hypothetical protein
MSRAFGSSREADINGLKRGDIMSGRFWIFALTFVLVPLPPKNGRSVEGMMCRLKFY